MSTNRLVVAIVITFALAACSFTARAQQMSTERAREVLATQKPLADPAFSLVLPDQNARRAAEKTYNEQIRALHALAGSSDQTLIPILIPYLRYTTHNVPAGVDVWSHRVTVGIKEVSEEYPAFAVIVSIRGADKALADYVLDGKNSLDSRFTAFHVLRYVSPSEFLTVKKTFHKEFLGARAPAKRRLEAVENENVPFDGQSSISTLGNDQ